MTIEDNDLGDLLKEITQKKRIITNESLFDQILEKEATTTRKNETMQLIDHFNQLMNEKAIEKKLLVIGSSGTGKTVISNLVGRYIQNQSKEIFESNFESLIFFYSNCSHIRSCYSLLTTILKQLIPYFPVRGYSCSELLHFLFKVLNESKKRLILCLDELECIKINKKNVEDFNALFRINDNWVVQEGGHLVSFVLISRSEQALKILDEITRRKFERSKIVFSKYSVDQLEFILQSKAKHCLVNDSYNLKVLKYIAEKSVWFGSARYTIDILRLTARRVENDNRQSITKKDVDLAIKNILPREKVFFVKTLSFELQVFLLAIVEVFNNNLDKTELSSKEITKHYKTLCQKLNIQPRKTTQLWKYINELNQLSIISTKVVNKQSKKKKSKGRITMISFNKLDSIETIKQLLEEQIKTYFTKH